MAIKWNDPDVRERLVASLIGAMGGTVNCKEVARLFGGEATYNAVECALRKPKKLAKELLEEAAGRKSPTKSPVKAQTPKKNNSDPLSNGVKTGRVTKKKATGSPIKKEVLQDENTFLTSGAEADFEGEGDVC